MKRLIFAIVVLVLAFAFSPVGDLKAAEAATAARPQVLPPTQGIQKPIPGPTEKPSSALIVPLTINYQGRLTNASGAPITVPTIMEFRIYDGPGGGALLLWGPQITPVSPDGEGYYSTSLGTGPPFPPNLFDGIPRWVGVTVPPDPEMLPRQEIQSVAYAINADRLGGLTSGDYVKIAGDQMTGELGVQSGGPYGIKFTAGLYNGALNFFVDPVGGGQVAVDGYLFNSRFTAADVFGGAAGGDPNSIASTGYSTTGSASSTGLYGYAAGSSINRAVHGQAGGGTENWSGYFESAPVRVGAGGLAGVDVATGAGDLYVASDLEVDGSITLPPAFVPAAGSVALPFASTASAAPATLTSFTVTTPGPGFLLVTVAGQWWYDADAGGAGSLITLFNMGLCTAPASNATCGGTYVDRWYQDADNVSAANSTHGFTFTQVFPVAGGPVTYYLNADNSGSGFTLFLYPGAVATALFVPASLPVATPKPVAPEVLPRNE